MQRDMFLATLISDRARPAVALPLSVQVINARRLRSGAIECAGIVRKGRDPAAEVCRELVRLGHPATHMQVYDGAVACFFMGIREAAQSHPEIPAEAGIAAGVTSNLDVSSLKLPDGPSGSSGLFEGAPSPTAISQQRNSHGQTEEAR